MGMSQRYHKNLKGNRYGRLTVLEFVPTESTHTSTWKCQCDCGKNKNVAGTNLTFGHTTSCGCYAVERTKVRNSRSPGQAGFNGLRNNYRRGALRRGLAWELSASDCTRLFALKCAYCGTEPQQIYKGGSANGTFVYNGLDRVDNTLGYTLTNTVPCCKFCNRAKQTMTLEEFRLWVKRVSQHLAL